MHDGIHITCCGGGAEPVVVSVSGRLDAAGAAVLEQECRALHAAGKREVVVSLAEVSFIASSGLGTLLVLSDLFRGDGGRIVFAGASRTARDVLRLLNLEPFLSLADDVDAAVSVCAEP